MTLTTRLSLFFTVSLAVVLVGFSVGLGALAARALYRQADDRLQAALNTLVAAAEINPRGVEWEPGQRLVALQLNRHDEPIAWLVTDEAGRRLDSSSLLPPEFAAQSTAMTTNPESRRRIRVQGATWQFLRRQVPEARPSIAENPNGKKAHGRAAVVLHPYLTITVGQSLAPVEATLRTLAGILGLLTLGVGLIAALASRWVCRKALAPVALMAYHTRSMTASDLNDRLPRVNSRDELQELSRGFNGLLDRLQESFERQRRFTGDASHQLRTPLTAMLGQIEVALRKNRSVEDYHRVLSSLQRQGQHLKHIIEGLLFLARADSEGRLTELEPLNLSEWLADHLQSWSEHPRWNDLTLTAPANEPALVACQPTLLGEMLNNLLDNAFKYSQPGTPVTVRVENLGTTVQLHIEDHGIGIIPEERAGLFQPFFRAEQARSRGIAGLGLGLAVAARLARAFKATITAESAEGCGTRFTVSMPSMRTGAEIGPGSPVTALASAASS
jgi:signal transduction histidine kinase